MENFDKEAIEKTLWDYIDGNTEASQRSAIEQLIAENAAWREQYDELLQVHQLLHSTELEHPSLRFTRNVMEEIARYQITPAARKYINNKIIFGIAAFFITVIVSFLIYGISQIDWSTGNTDNPIGIDVTAVDYGKMFNNSFVNIFMMANVVLGLMLLDRYLNIRKKNLRAGL
jgi:hypothetical protein